MDSPNFYSRANKVQRRDAEQILQEFLKRLQWRSDGADNLLDVGSGSGDVLIDFIYKQMPQNFNKIVGSDISPEMVSYAKHTYQTFKKCDFKVLDISTEIALPTDLKDQFDHVTSFYCLQWIVNKRQAVRNIFNLLRTKGSDCLLVFLAQHPIYEAYKLLSRTKKWSAFMQDIDRYTLPLLYLSDPKVEFSKILEEEKFSNIKVEVRDQVYSYEGLENFKDNFRVVNPFLPKIPSSLHDSYILDLVGAVSSLGLRQTHPSEEFDFIFKMPYKLIVAYAQK